MAKNRDNKGKKKADLIPASVSAEMQKLDLQAISVKGAPKISTIYGTEITCVGAWRVENTPNKQSAFNSRVGFGNIQTLYHGTSSCNVLSITKDSLRPGSAHCMFGAGIYLGKMQKAFQYGNFLFKVKAILGRSLIAVGASHYTYSYLRENGYHSVHGARGLTASYGGSLINDEWVVYDPNQVLVEEVYEYRITYKSSGTCVCAKEIPKAETSVSFCTQYKACGERGAEEYKTNKGNVRLCAKCVQRLRLKTGSTVQVYTTSTVKRRESPLNTVKLV